MSTYEIEIPEPVVTANAQYEPTIERDGKAAWFAWVEVGGVRVIERRYDAEWGAYEHAPDNYAEDSDDAERLVLEEFGERLKTLLEG